MSNLGLLFFFKYFNFLSINLNKMFSSFAIPIASPVLDILLPVGISFYTFQTLSYTIDVYNRKIPAEKHFGYFALYVSFFPQLVAGPIERPQNLLPQLKIKHEFDYERVTYGLKLMAWGLFKKMVIADTLAIYVNKVYNNLPEYQGFVLVIATVFFTLQIYCDFSGYSDIAIGAARMLGIDLMKNFNAPYLATSIKDFWSRWHISLSTWFRDYVYIPLGGNRVDFSWQIFNLLVTFLLSGLWHGANWTFVVWGALHGFLLILETLYDRYVGKKLFEENKFVIVAKTVATFSVVAFAWIFFRANNIDDAFYVLVHMFDGIVSPVKYIKTGFYSLGVWGVAFRKLMFPVLILFLYDYYEQKVSVINKISKYKWIYRWTVYIVFVLYVIFVTPKNTTPDFIYFQF